MTEIGVADADLVVAAVQRGERAEPAKALVLHQIWVNEIDSWKDDPAARLENVQTHWKNAAFSDAVRALERILAAGAEPQDVALFARLVAFEASFGTFYALGGGFWGEAVDDVWEVAGDDAFDCLGDLHEELLMADPSGREGEPRP